MEGTIRYTIGKNRLFPKIPSISIPIVHILVFGNAKIYDFNSNNVESKLSVLKKETILSVKYIIHLS